MGVNDPKLFTQSIHSKTFVGVHWARQQRTKERVKRLVKMKSL